MGRGQELKLVSICGRLKRAENSLTPLPLTGGSGSSPIMSGWPWWLLCLNLVGLALSVSRHRFKSWAASGRCGCGTLSQTPEPSGKESTYSLEGHEESLWAGVGEERDPSQPSLSAGPSRPQAGLGSSPAGQWPGEHCPVVPGDGPQKAESVCHILPGCLTRKFMQHNDAIVILSHWVLGYIVI